MNQIIKNEINEIRKSIPSAKGMSDDFLFTVVCHKYINCDGRFDESDFDETFVDGKDDGGIDMVFADNQSDEEKLILMQGKNTSIGSEKDAVLILKKMKSTVSDFEENITAKYNKNLKRVYRNAKDDLPEGHNTEFVLFCSENFESNKKFKYQETVSKDKDLEIFDPKIYFEDDIVKRINEINDPLKFVEYDKVDLVHETGKPSYIEYSTKDEEGILCTVSALSLKKLYEKHQGKGLFEQNFREYIKAKDVDDAIDNSLQYSRHQFWFRNNGVIIGCKEYKAEAQKVSLTEFSIINGCQTVSKIGKYKGSNESEDFAVVCKIVSSKNENKAQKFIGSVAEASNSQKKIELRDLKSNTYEQRELQKNLMADKPKIFLEIKRGVTLLTQKEKKLNGVDKNGEPWRYLKNDDYGQMIGGFDFGKPNLRSSKKSLFADKQLYRSIFISKKFDKDCIVDKLWIFHLFKEYKSKAKRDGIFANDNIKQDILKYGNLHIPSIISVMLKIYRGYIDPKDYKPELIKNDCLEGRLLKNPKPDNLEELFESLFVRIINNVFLIYNNSGQTSMTNFFKTEKNFSEIIMSQIIDMVYKDPITKKEVDSIFDQIFLK